MPSLEMTNQTIGSAVTEPVQKRKQTRYARVVSGDSPPRNDAFKKAVPLRSVRKPLSRLRRQLPCKGSRRALPLCDVTGCVVGPALGQTGCKTQNRPLCYYTTIRLEPEARRQSHKKHDERQDTTMLSLSSSFFP